MNVTILGADNISQIVAKTIEEGYNIWLEENFNKVPLNVMAYVSGRSNYSVIGGKAVLSFEQCAALYHKGIINKIIFPREVYAGQRPELNYLRKLGIDVKDIWITNRLSKSCPGSLCSSGFIS